YGTPQSYTGHEPAGLRAIQEGFDPHKQVRARIVQLQAIGHDVDKVELIVLGGTQLAQPPEYLGWFTRECLNAMTGVKTKTIKEAQGAAERASIRNVGITFETRPDYAKEKHVDLLLKLGATRVELGVQTVYDDVYEFIKRGHTVKDVAEATRILKDSGFAIIYHIMPGLPGSDHDRDLDMFSKLFEDQNFMPDGLKIYPCLVIRGTELHERWRAGEFKAMTAEEAVKLIAEVKRSMPRWVRVHRIQRDIPAKLIEAGVRRGNLAQMVEGELKKLDARCRCIRCREVGLMMLRKGIQPELEDVKLLEESYGASEGEEIFLSFEDVERDILIGFLRLRLPSAKAHRPEIDENIAVVRELHVYGSMVPVGKEAKVGDWQHRGWGEDLLKEAERAARERDARKMAILSGIGVRNYYKRFDYRREGPYMVKELS
ncbi:MAG: radical SAM protein, partial [Hadesarchaea archaeon DG-33-1]